MPDDVPRVVSRIIEQDSLFREGFCRPERIDMEVQCAIATYLEYLDLKEMLPELSKEDEWREAVELFSPRLSELLMTFGNPEKLPGRLEAIGLMRRDVDNR